MKVIAASQSKSLRLHGVAESIAVCIVCTRCLPTRCRRRTFIQDTNINGNGFNDLNLVGTSDDSNYEGQSNNTDDIGPHFSFHDNLLSLLTVSEWKQTHNVKSH